MYRPNFICCFLFIVIAEKCILFAEVVRFYARKAFVWHTFLVSSNGVKLFTTWISRV